MGESVAQPPLVPDALGREIADWGAEIVTAGTADEAVYLICAAPQRVPDVAVVDRDLGSGMNGLKLMDRLRTWFGVAIPTVFVTGAADPDALLELRVSGRPWLIKPIDAETLKKVVGDLIATRPPGRTRDSRKNAGTPPNAAAPQRQLFSVPARAIDLTVSNKARRTVSGIM
jgi:CheY-like chemotaxis protein